MIVIVIMMIDKSKKYWINEVVLEVTTGLNKTSVRERN
jgi:hypothetical protein